MKLPFINLKKKEKPAAIPTSPQVLSSSLIYGLSDFTRYNPDDLIGKKGYKRSPEVGWGSPSQVKGLSKDGKVLRDIATPAEVETLDAKKDIAVISGSVGKRKKIEI